MEDKRPPKPRNFSWYSICSGPGSSSSCSGPKLDGSYNPECPRCNVGQWVNDDLQKLEDWLDEHDHQLWLKWANREAATDQPGHKAQHLFPGLRRNERAKANKAYVLRFAPQATYKKWLDEEGRSHYYVTSPYMSHPEGGGVGVPGGGVTGGGVTEEEAWGSAAINLYGKWSTIYLGKLVVEGKTLSEEETKFVRKLIGEQYCREIGGEYRGKDALWDE